jgi:hypothetical protein
MKRTILIAAALASAAASWAQAPSLPELLRPSMVKLGVMPNLDGLLDGNFAATVRWSRSLSSSVSADYSGRSDSQKDSSGEAVLEAKTFGRDYSAHLKLLDFLHPIALGAGSGLGIGAALACSYSGESKSISGYKTVQGETVFFNQDRLVHRIMPTVDLGAAFAAGPSLTGSVGGAFLPYVYMIETGSKLYSTYDEAIPYTLHNACKGWRAEAELAAVGGLGGASLKVELTSLFGKYGTVQKVVTGNYATTIETYSDYASLEGSATLELKLGFLKKSLGLVPAISLGCGLSSEAFEGAKLDPSLRWRAGVTVGSR